MSTNKGFWRRAVLWTAVGTLGWLGTARADVVADQAAAILVFPKIEVDTTDSVTNPNKPKIDTVVQITNTSPFLTRARCYYVNANGKCSNAGATDSVNTAPVICRTTDDCNPGTIRGGVCVPGWEERDFQLTLTKRQPLSWNASTGLSGNDVPLTNGRTSKDGQSNDPTNVPSVQEDPFIGELKCVQVDTATEEPIDRNDLKGEATITTVLPLGGVDVRKYNAVGIQSTGFQDGDPTTLTLGGPDAEYNACPNVIILDHYFDSLDLSGNEGVESHNDGAGNPLVTGRVATDLVVVPCSEDFLTQDPKYGSAVLQFLIYNEFEQRFSSSTRVDCFKQIQLSDINTRPGPSDNASSIFSQAVQGTLTGQTRIRPVSGVDRAHRVLVMAEERWEARPVANGIPVYTTARNVQNIQPTVPTDAPLPDIIQLSPLVQ